METDEWLSVVRHVVKRSLHAVGMKTPTIEPDVDLYKLCYNAALSKGYLAEGWMSLGPYFAVGVAVSQTAYGHLENTGTRVWLAIYTAFTAALDDTHAQVPGDVISHFIVRMTAGQQQPYRNLEHYAAVLREVSLHLDGVRAGLFLTSTFNWITSLSVDRTMLGREIPPASARFAGWCGLMSGICEAFALPAFPPDVPLHAITPAIPDMMTVLRNFNDVFSFYKEEHDGDPACQISLLARTWDQSKLEVLAHVADEAIVGHRNICAALAGHSEASRAWMAFVKGFIEFHYATERYRLRELDLDSE